MNKQKRQMSVFVAIMAIAIVGTISIGSSYAASSNPDQYVAHISPKIAANIAINHLSTQPSNLVKVDLDNENGVHVYSVEFIISNQEVSVEIDPQTGEVLKVEQHPVETSNTESDASDEPDTGDGETADDNTESNEPATGDGDGETADDLG